MSRLASPNRQAVRRMPNSPGGLGLNYPWQNDHFGSESLAFVGPAYNGAKVDADLAGMAALGVTKIRAWLCLEAAYSYANSTFTVVPAYMANVHDFLTRANSYGLSVIAVLSDGGSATAPQNGDGKLRWDLVKTTAGTTAYANAFVDYVTHLAATHGNVIAWELVNEPYGNLSFSAYPQSLGVTWAQTHTFLKACYQAVKAVTALPVCFSDYEEEQQAQYQLFSDPAKRAAYVDDCTDIYNMHIYRQLASQVFNFLALTSKPKWLTEVGALNYTDLTGANHGGQPAASQLFDPEINAVVTRQLMQQAFAVGFSLVMPWAWGDNNGFVTHNADGSHTLHQLPLWIKNQLMKRVPVATRPPVYVTSTFPSSSTYPSSTLYPGV